MPQLGRGLSREGKRQEHGGGSFGTARLTRIPFDETVTPKIGEHLAEIKFLRPRDHYARLKSDAYQRLRTETKPGGPLVQLWSVSLEGASMNFREGILGYKKRFRSTLDRCGLSEVHGHLYKAHEHDAGSCNCA